MAEHMVDLPNEPSFPVYGLDDTFVGYRWLVLWNTHQHLYTVSLGHGHPGGDDSPRRSGEKAAWLTVTTYLKTERCEIKGGSPTAIGPTGYQDALINSLLGLAERALPDSKQVIAWLREQEGQVAWGSADQWNAPEDHGIGWFRGTTNVDGVPTSSVSRPLDGWWATLVDLPTVALAITGPDSMSSCTSLVDVRTRLGDYR